MNRRISNKEYRIAKSLLHDSAVPYSAVRYSVAANHTPRKNSRTASISSFSKGGLGGISNRKGYTLVEVLVALGILGFGLLAVASMQVTAIKTNAVASKLSQGLTVAQAKVEELMNLPYDHNDLADKTPFNGTDQDLLPATTDGEGDGIDDDGGNFGLNDTTGADGSEPNGMYTIYWNVAVGEPASNSKKVRVIVTWTERGKNKRIALDFVRTDLS